MAAAAASSRCFRARQSFSRTARRLSASRLVSRSSCSAIGKDVRRPSVCANASTLDVISFAVPSSRRGRPITSATSPSSSPASRAISAAARSIASLSRPEVRTTPTGRASVPVTSLTATPIRRSPTSSPAMRPTLYNSRTERGSASHRRAGGSASRVAASSCRTPCGLDVLKGD